MLACHAGGPGWIPGRCSSIFGIWREVLGHNVYITSQYFFPAIIYRDIISHITITYRYIMYFFRTFKKSTAPYKVVVRESERVTGPLSEGKGKGLVGLGTQGGTCMEVYRLLLCII
jgi:hypothetical protein